MTAVYKVLGQVYPSATTNTDAYTVTSGKSAVVSSIQVCNQGSSNDSINIAIRQAGASLTNAQYIAFGDTVSSSSATNYSLGITLASTDIVTVWSLTGTTSFNLFGSEF